MQQLSARLESIRHHPKKETANTTLSLPDQSNTYDGRLTEQFELGSVFDQLRFSERQKDGSITFGSSPKKLGEGFELIPHDYASELLASAKRSGKLRPVSREGGLDVIIQDRSMTMRKSLEAMNQAEIDQLLRFQQDLSEHEKAFNKAG